MRLARVAAARWSGRALAIGLSATVATTSGASVAVAARSATVAPSDSITPATRARELNRQGQQRFDAQDYAGAAGDWSKILEVLPENDVNREERDNSLLIALEAYRQAYERRRLESGDGSLKAAVEFLRRAVFMLDTYVMEYERAYGKGAAISPDAQRSGDEIRKLLSEAEGQLTPEPPPPREDPKPTPAPVFTPVTVDRGPSGTGLIVAGSVCIALGLGSIGMLIGGVVIRNRARRDYRSAVNADPVDEAAQIDANRRGLNVANPLIITGAVLTGAFMVAGFTMLGIGIRRRVRYMAFSPIAGPRYAGVGIQGRF